MSELNISPQEKPQKRTSFARTSGDGTTVVDADALLKNAAVQARLRKLASLRQKIRRVAADREKSFVLGGVRYRYKARTESDIITPLRPEKTEPGGKVLDLLTKLIQGERQGVK